MSVQFFGRESVVDAYTNRGIQTWGIFEKKNFITAGEGAHSLTEFLKKLEPGGSMATYTLKVYKNCEDLDEITDKTECNGSFNFKLMHSLGGVGVSDSSRLAALEAKINGLDDDDDDEPEGLGEIVMGWLKEPQKLVPVIGALKELFHGNPGPAVAQMATIGNVEQGAPPYKAKTPEMDPLERVAAALDRLEKQDKDIITHLEKLADIAEKKPETFKFLISNLDAL